MLTFVKVVRTEGRIHISAKINPRRPIRHISEHIFDLDGIWDDWKGSRKRKIREFEFDATDFSHLECFPPFGLARGALCIYVYKHAGASKPRTTNLVRIIEPDVSGGNKLYSSLSRGHTLLVENLYHHQIMIRHRRSPG